MLTQGKMTTAEAVSFLKSDGRYKDLIRDSYLDDDVTAAAERFHLSAEFAEVRVLLQRCLPDAEILDLGAGTGIASYAFAKSGAGLVHALEPDDSEIGRAAICRLLKGNSIKLVNAEGESIPLPDESLDIVYTRQALHHTRDLRVVLQECSRVLKSGGTLLVCREHVVDNEEQLKQFLSEHVIHQLAGGEHAYSLEEYTDAITTAGLTLNRIFGPWDSIINAFPTVRRTEELNLFPNQFLRERFGRLGALLRFVPGIHALAWKRIRAYRAPGRLYTFLASKP